MLSDSVGRDIILLGDLNLPIGDQITIEGHKEECGECLDMFVVEKINGSPVNQRLTVHIPQIIKWPNKLNVTLSGKEIASVIRRSEANGDGGYHRPAQQTLSLHFHVDKVLLPYSIPLDNSAEGAKDAPASGNDASH